MDTMINETCETYKARNVENNDHFIWAAKDKPT